MKIAVLSDFHFGYGYNTELEEDSFENAREAISNALSSDMIIIAGDIFDTKFPKTPVWANAIKILAEAAVTENSGINLVSCSKTIKKISDRTLNHKPILALHGNHEFRGKIANTLEALENAGILLHLDKDTIVFEKDGVKVAVHGMSWTPDRYAKKEMEEWKPSPISGCLNILVLHQSILPFVYSPLERPSISTDDFPDGFDIIIDGHLHGAGYEEIKQKLLVFPGSTVITQFDKAEASAEKGFYEIEIVPNHENYDIKLAFKPILNSRKFFFEDVHIESSLRENIENRLKDIVAVNHKKRPLVKFRLKGSETEFMESDIKDLEKKYGEKVILRFIKELESPEITEKVEFLRNMRERRLSSEEIGLNLLHKNLEELKFESNFKVENIFSMLVEERVDEAFDVLTGQK